MPCDRLSLTIGGLQATLDEGISDHALGTIAAGYVVDHVTGSFHATGARTGIHALEVAAASLVPRTVLVEQALGPAADVRVTEVARHTCAHCYRVTLLAVGIGAARRREARVDLRWGRRSWRY